MMPDAQQGGEAIDMKEAAHAYAEAGIPVFPIRKGTKFPLIKGGGGFKDATCDPEQIELWWTRDPDANIGIPTGRASGWYVIDIDKGKGGEESWAKITAGRPIYCPMTETGGGGNHLIFSCPDGRFPASVSNVNGWQGIDIRAEGGYIVAPPSMHASGNRYNVVVPVEGDINPAPEWVLSAIGVKGESSTAITPESSSLPGQGARGHAPSTEVRIDLPGVKPSGQDPLADLPVALAYISSDDYSQWIRVGMALESTGHGDEAFKLWLEWSKRSPKFKDASDCRSHWDSFGIRQHEVQVATVFYLAQQAGWEPPVPHAAPVASLDDSPIALLDTQIATGAVLEGCLEPRQYLMTRGTLKGEVAAPGMGDKFLSLGETACLTAEGGTGKTTALFQFAACVATGTDWMGHFHVTRSSPRGVLFLLGEEDWRQVRETLHRIHRVEGFSAEDLHDIERLVQVLPLKGVLAPLVQWNGKANAVQTTTHFDALQRRLETPPPESDGWAAVIIDPLSRFSAAGVESDNERATAFWQHMERLPACEGNPSVVVAMHSSKQARRSQEVDARGVTSLTDSARHELAMKNEQDGSVTFQAKKMNYAPGWWNMPLERRDGGLLRAMTPEDAEAAKETKAENRIHDMAQEIHRIAQGQREPKSREFLAQMLGGRLSQARAAVDLAAELGKLTAVKEGRHTRFLAVS